MLILKPVVGFQTQVDTLLFNEKFNLVYFSDHIFNYIQSVSVYVCVFPIVNVINLFHVLWRPLKTL